MAYYNHPKYFFPNKYGPYIPKVFNLEPLHTCKEIKSCPKPIFFHIPNMKLFLYLLKLRTFYSPKYLFILCDRKLSKPSQERFECPLSIATWAFINFEINKWRISQQFIPPYWQQISHLISTCKAEVKGIGLIIYVRKKIIP